MLIHECIVAYRNDKKFKITSDTLRTPTVPTSRFGTDTMSTIILVNQTKRK